MKNLYLSGLVLMLLSAAAQGIADVPLSQRHEVRHLLDFMKNTDCAIERNNIRYRGEEAYAHILNKYEHFRDRITSTEAFIEYAAARSTMSGAYYTVQCDGAASMKTGSWLLEELRKYRDK